MSKIVKEGEVIYSKLAVINYMLNFKSKSKNSIYLTLYRIQQPIRKLRFLWFFLINQIVNMQD